MRVGQPRLMLRVEKRAKECLASTTDVQILKTFSLLDSCTEQFYGTCTEIFHACANSVYQALSLALLLGGAWVRRGPGSGALNNGARARLEQRKFYATYNSLELYIS